MEKVREWIEHILIHIQEVIDLEGGHEDEEGRLKGQLKKRVH